MISNPLVVGLSDRRVERLLQRINLQPNFSPGLNMTNRSSTFLSKAGTVELVCQCSVNGIQQSVDLGEIFVRLFASGG